MTSNIPAEKDDAAGETASNVETGEVMADIAGCREADCRLEFADELQLPKDKCGY